MILCLSCILVLYPLVPYLSVGGLACEQVGGGGGVCVSWSRKSQNKLHRTAHAQRSPFYYLDYWFQVRYLFVTSQAAVTALGWQSLFKSPPLAAGFNWVQAYRWWIRLGLLICMKYNSWIMELITLSAICVITDKYVSIVREKRCLPKVQYALTDSVQYHSKTLKSIQFRGTWSHQF